MKKRFACLALLVLLAAAGCGPKGTGTLHGTVSIGPLSPVETPGQPTEVPCEVYAARKVVIYDKDGDKELHVVDIDCGGRYSIKLEAGTYTVDINRLGIDRADGLPKQVVIMADTTTRLDIDIDTGIR